MGRDTKREMGREIGRETFTFILRVVENYQNYSYIQFSTTTSTSQGKRLELQKYGRKHEYLSKQRG